MITPNVKLVVPIKKHVPHVVMVSELMELLANNVVLLIVNYVPPIKLNVLNAQVI